MCIIKNIKPCANNCWFLLQQDKKRPVRKNVKI